MAKRRKTVSFALLFVAFVTLSLFWASFTGGTAFAKTTAQNPPQHPQFTTLPLHKLSTTSQALHPDGPRARMVRPSYVGDGSLPIWSSSFSSAGRKYSYTMIGTDPNNGSATTTVPVDIVPLIFSFADGSVSDGTTIVDSIVNSPIFQNNGPYTTGDTTQYVDAMQRAEFWKTVSSVSPDYHLLLGTPTVQPSVSFTIPASLGSGSNTTGKRGLINFGAVSPALDQLATTSISSSHLTIFAALDINLYINKPANCCVGGYHTATQAFSGVPYTYAYATYNTASGAFANVAALSHELAEWANDPLVGNGVPKWSVPDEPQYGCNSSLEVGDPEVGKLFNLNGYDLQDEAYFSWFAREDPSQGYNGQYDYLGNFSSYSASC